MLQVQRCETAKITSLLDMWSLCPQNGSSLSMDEQLYRPEKLKSFSTLQYVRDDLLSMDCA